MRDVDLALLPRWRGQRGRLEVHYLTATDPVTGTGLWLHHEVVAPTSGDPYGHGWIALFPATGEPTCERFGPSPAQPLTDGSLFRSPDAEMSSTTARGHAGAIAWDLAWDEGSHPLWTFPRWAWERRVLPAAQVVPTPATQLRGTVGGTAYAGTAGIAHIDGHGNAQRWIWLHAPLGGDDVLEIVAATARRPGMRVLPPLALVQLRVAGSDWPADPLAVAPLFRTRVDNHAFRVRGAVGRRRLTVDVSLPEDRCVRLGYTDPDGATATCTNTERADARITVDQMSLSGWQQQRSWALHATAHAEIGTRP